MLARSESLKRQGTSALGQKRTFENTQLSPLPVSILDGRIFPPHPWARLPRNRRPSNPHRDCFGAIRGIESARQLDRNKYRLETPVSPGRNQATKAPLWEDINDRPRSCPNC